MLSSPIFSHSAIAAPHKLAAATGQAILAEGGNALEAMLAMAATIAVVYPHMNGIGGDGFWLIRQPSGRVTGIEACGAAGSKATIAAYRAKDYEQIPPRGPDAALTVPGAVSGWIKAAEAAAALGGRLPIRLLLAEAMAYARDGVPVSGSEAREEPKEWERLKSAPGFLQTYFIDGKAPKSGAIRRFPALAATLEQMAHSGLNDFYRGDIGREIAADCEQLGTPITRADIEKQEARLREPLSLSLPGVTLYNFPPPTQGLASLLLLGIFDKLVVETGGGFAHLHGLIEAAKRAYSIRDRVITDFDAMVHDPATFLANERLEREASRISMRRAADFPLAEEDGDTIWMGAIDKSSLAVSYIQSLYWEYGSGTVLPRTGLLMQNRGIAFSLDPRSKNPLTPGRRPFHTLNPPLAVFEDGRIASYGAMGGDGQPQFQAQIFTRYARFGESVTAALDAPRFLFGRTWGSSSSSVKVEDRFDESLLRALRSAGHRIEIVNKPYADDFGHAGLLVRHADGHIEADHDPRSDGGASGL